MCDQRKIEFLALAILYLLCNISLGEKCIKYEFENDSEFMYFKGDFQPADENSYSGNNSLKIQDPRLNSPKKGLAALTLDGNSWVLTFRWQKTGILAQTSVLEFYIDDKYEKSCNNINDWGSKPEKIIIYNDGNKSHTLQWILSSSGSMRYQGKEPSSIAFIDDLEFCELQSANDASLGESSTSQNSTPDNNSKKIINSNEITNIISQSNNNSNNISHAPPIGSSNYEEADQRALEVIVIPTPESNNNYDRFSKIQNAIDKVREGGIVRVTNGEYYENLVVNKSIKLIGIDKNRTIIKPGNKSQNGISLEADNITISGFTIDGWDKGIKLKSVSGSIIDNNIIVNNSQGILVSSCSEGQTRILNNSIFDNIQEGIRLYKSSKVYVNLNNINNYIRGKFGIVLGNARSCNITNNNISSFCGIEVVDSYLNNISNNEFFSTKNCKIHLEDSERNSIDLNCTYAICINNGESCSCCN
ncbi:MAG: right-handed parallel beta-helix repeat-containing protein [Methanothrix sp.]|nr:right-handed parallel beta-helix repeat-containing protein [Methanothrix sp.]